MRMKPLLLLALFSALAPALKADIEASEKKSLRDFCEFEQPELLNYYLPTFGEDPETEDKYLPVVDMIIGRDGNAIDAIFIGDSPSKEIQDSLYLMARWMRFEPAIACGEKTEGFYRFSPFAYHFLDENPDVTITVLPFAKFILPNYFFKLLKVNSFFSNKNQVNVRLSISKEGKILNMKGLDNFSNNLAKMVLPKLMENYTYTPAMAGDTPVPCNIILRFNLEAPQLDEAVLNKIKRDEARRPLPVKPKEISYEKPKKLKVFMRLTSAGIASEFQFLDLMEPAETASLLNALRNWYIPQDEENSPVREYLLTFMFLPESPTAVLLEEDERKYVITNPIPVKQRPPYFPPDALRNGKQGVVEVIFVVSKNGSVLKSEATPISNPIFVESALHAVNKWKFKPATLDGEPINSRCRILIPFRVNK